MVNATPLGLAGGMLPGAVIADAAGLLEMNYGNGDTPAAVSLRARGLPVAEGELMLVGQGAASFSIWTGVDVTPTVMLAALDARRRDRRSAERR